MQISAAPSPVAPLSLNVAGVRPSPSLQPAPLVAPPAFGAQRLVRRVGLVAIDPNADDRLAQRRRPSGATSTTSTTSSATPSSGGATQPAQAAQSTPASADAPATSGQASGAPAPANDAAAAPASGDAPAAAPAEAAAPAAAEPAGPAGPAEPAGPAGPAGADGSAAADEPSIDLIQHRQQNVGIHRPLGIATFATLTATVVLGTFASINQRTWFGPGECRAGGSPILGFEFGCNGLSALHGVFAFATVSLYATTGIYALSMPDPERAAEGDSRGAVRLRIHKALAWVHAIGMVAMPILGFLGANPNAFGIQDTRGDFAAAFRSTHEILGFVTWGALGAAMVVELIP